MTATTTRPEIAGTFGVVASTHWAASAAGMRMLELGGNAIDAAVATGFALQILEPHLNGPAGDLPALIRLSTGEIRVLCAQGPAPAAATPDHFRSLGIKMIPGNGLLPGVVPGAFDGWALMLRDHGTMDLAEVLLPAISCAAKGHPLLPETARAIGFFAPFFAEHWPTSHAAWCPDGHAPEPGQLFHMPALAETYRRLAACPGDSREARIDAARAAWSQGFVSEAIAEFVKTPVRDVTGADQAGLLTREDMAAWQASFEAPVEIDYHGWRVFKTGPWGQGPVLLQALRILQNFNLAALDPSGPDFVHLVIEAVKLAYADREAYYGDPAFSDIPLDALLSAEYGAARAAHHRCCLDGHAAGAFARL